MTSLLAISITINLAIIAVVTFFKKHKLLQIIYNKNTYQEYETIFNTIFECAPIAVRLRVKKKVQNLNAMWYKEFAKNFATQGDFGHESP